MGEEGLILSRAALRGSHETLVDVGQVDAKLLHLLQLLPDCEVIELASDIFIIRRQASDLPTVDDTKILKVIFDILLMFFNEQRYGWFVPECCTC